MYLGSSLRDPTGAFVHYPSPNAKKAGSILTWLHQDHQSSIRRMTDAAGTLLTASVYQPFGAATQTTPVVATPIEPKGYIGERSFRSDRCRNRTNLMKQKLGVSLSCAENRSPVLDCSTNVFKDLAGEN